MMCWSHWQQVWLRPLSSSPSAGTCLSALTSTESFRKTSWAPGWRRNGSRSMQVFPLPPAEGDVCPFVFGRRKKRCKWAGGHGDAVAAPHSRACGLLWWNANDAETRDSCLYSAGGKEEVGRPPRSLPSETLGGVITWEWREKRCLCKYRLNPRRAQRAHKRARLTFL